jgi:hypothetical protein
MILIYFHADNQEPSYMPIELPDINTGEFGYHGRSDHVIRCHIQVSGRKKGKKATALDNITYVRHRKFPKMVRTLSTSMLSTLLSPTWTFQGLPIFGWARGRKTKTIRTSPKFG